MNQSFECGKKTPSVNIGCYSYIAYNNICSVYKFSTSRCCRFVRSSTVMVTACQPYAATRRKTRKMQFTLLLSLPAFYSSRDVPYLFYPQLWVLFSALVAAAAATYFYFSGTEHKIYNNGTFLFISYYFSSKRMQAIMMPECRLYGWCEATAWPLEHAPFLSTCVTTHPERPATQC